MRRIAFIDIGELGWSLYLSAHIRWLKRNTISRILVMTSPGRKCLYKGLADSIINIPNDFYRTFKGSQECFGLYETPRIDLRKYFEKRIPADYMIPPYFIFKCNPEFPKSKFIYKSYEHSNGINGKREIMILPRCRKEIPFNNRNLPEQFYEDLINKLCDNFRTLIIRSVGTIQGAYDIKIDKPNYVNFIGKTKSIQDLIDRLQVAKVAIGSQSAPPKLALIQNVPAFMIGHQKTRHMNTDNPMNTKVGFYEIPVHKYDKIIPLACINEIVRFVRTCI